MKESGPKGDTQHDSFYVTFYKRKNRRMEGRSVVASKVGRLTTKGTHMSTFRVMALSCIVLCGRSMTIYVYQNPEDYTSQK